MNEMEKGSSFLNFVQIPIKIQELRSTLYLSQAQLYLKYFLAKKTSEFVIFKL